MELLLCFWGGLTPLKFGKLWSKQYKATRTSHTRWSDLEILFLRSCLFMDPNNLLTIFLFSVVYRELGSRFRATPGYTSPVGIFLCLETPARPGRTTSCKFG